MGNKNYKKVNLTSSNLSEEKLMELQRILPEAFSKNKIDWEKLRIVLGDAIDSRIEKFSFIWAGKSNAIKNVLIPSKATVHPAEDESVKFDERRFPAAFARKRAPKCSARFAATSPRLESMVRTS